MSEDFPEKTKIFVVAIDGPAASGKGTLARDLADILGYAYLDTGALYRAAALEVLRAGGSCADEDDAERGAGALRAKIESGGQDAALSNPDLRNDAVAQGASKVAAIPAVREALIGLQREFAQNPGGYNGCVLDGRDIGTVICPEADVKLFVTADQGIRAERRMKELQSKGIDATYEAVLADMRTRDGRDSGRRAAPLRPAEGSVVLDTTDLSAAEALAEALRIVKQTLDV
ncbi:MAG: (d)CMP kinase [Alphaproteobacteria bacterium]|nr:(d)CMP kinase [Alphaproteobacteria bacterium]